MENKKFNWRNYNKSQTREKIIFLKLLRELCAILPEKYQTNSNNPLRPRKVIFSVCMKNYCRTSGRSVIGELDICRKLGYLKEKTPCFNSIFSYLKNPAVTIILQDMIKLTALPLASIETKICGDSTGIGTRIVHDRWSVIRQNYSKHHKYMKLHASFGTISNIITSCRVTHGTQADSPMLSVLVDETCENFKPEEYSWDKAYLSRKNMEKIWEYGCLPVERG